MIRYLLVFFLFSLFSMFSQTSERFNIKSIGINTTSNEFGTVVSKSGGIYYLKSGFKGKIDLDEFSANLYRGEISDRGEITKGLKFPTDAIHAVFTNDGQYVYFSKKVGSKFQLFKAFIDNTGRWKDEIRLPFNDLNFNFKQPALSIDNTKLFFVSDKSDSNGSTDIYYVDIKNKGLEYGDPVHLSFYVNSPGEEIFPYIGENDKIYFSSDGMGGEGGLDIYESFLSNGQYEKTANLGVPINSEFDDFAYTLTSGNSKGYFSSNRQGGKGGVDIYYFEDRKPTLNNCSQSISGFVKSKDNQKPIFEAIVEVFDSNGNSENTLTDEQGQFVFENIECEASIDIVAYKESYNGFAEAHIIPKKSNVISLFLNPEFPEGFKEEFDLSNEMVAIDTKTNEIIIPEKNKPADKKAIPIEKEESNKVALNKPKIEKKVVEEYYDPLDYDPYSQPKKATPKKVVEDEPKKEVITKKEDIDPLDYDPYSQSPKKKEVVITKNTEIDADSKPQKKVVADYDPLDYDPKTQSKNDPKQKAQETDRIKKEADDKARIEKERQDKLLAQQKVLEEERQKRIAEAKATADKLKIAEDAKNAEIAQQEIQQKAEVESQKQAQAQAIADAKKRDEQQLQEKESIAKASIEKAKQAETDRIKKEADDKARIEKERQDKLLAQQKVLEEERQKRIAEAKATADKLKIAEDAKNAEIAQQEIQQIAEVESQKQAQAQAIADAKKRDEQQLQEKESIAKASIEKAKQAEADRIKKEADDKARIEKERQDKLLAQQKVLEEERQKRIAEAKATADKLKIAEDAKNAEIAQQEIQQKAEVESQKQAQAQAIADAKERDEQQLQEKESIAKASIEKAKQAEADRIKKEADDKARIEKERQDKLLAQQKVLEEERQKRIAEAKATADKLKIAEDAKNAEIAQQEIQQKAEVESQKQAQAQAIADAKKRDEQQLQEKESIAKASIEKAKQAEADRIKKEADDKARIEKESQDKLLAQQKVLEEERQKRIAEAKATADKLKIAEDAKNAEIAQQEIISNIRISDKIINGSTNVSSAKQLQINKVIDSYTTLLKEKELAIKQIEENQIINEVETNNTVEDKVCAKNVNGNVLNSKTREALSNVTIDMYYDGQNIETTSTDKNGNFNFYNVDCNTKYILICYREYYDNIAQAEIFTEGNIKDISILLEPNQSKNPVAINPKNEDDEMTYYIEPKEIEAPKVKAGKVVLNPIYFDLDEWYLTSEARRELDKIIVLMKMNPTMIVESGSHTDTRGRFEYNLELSEKRSQETVGYLVANGVDPDRISGRGYGETMPVNHCLDGVKCSEADHMNNRRTEFVILKY